MSLNISIPLPLDQPRAVPSERRMRLRALTTVYERKQASDYTACDIIGLLHVWKLCQTLKNTMSNTMSNIEKYKFY